MSLLNILSRKGWNLLAFLGCYVLIAIAYFYMEKALYLNPCPLCYAQRIMFAILGFWFLIAAFSSRGAISRITNGIILAIISIGGASVSARHLWLQYGPKDESGVVAGCGQDFHALFENTPLWDAINIMLVGSGDCGEIQWTLFNISIPGWTFIAFICFAILAIVNNIFRR